jgi:hypothetical protein
LCTAAIVAVALCSFQSIKVHPAEDFKKSPFKIFVSFVQFKSHRLMLVERRKFPSSYLFRFLAQKRLTAATLFMVVQGVMAFAYVAIAAVFTF